MKDKMDIIQSNIFDEEGFDLANILTTAQTPERATVETSDPYTENPFDLFPTELVSVVFLLVSESRIPLERYQVPGRLAPTCRRFRDIVYDSPELWTTAVVRSNVDASHLPSYLTHSRDRPLHIDTHLPDLTYHTKGPNIKELAAPVLGQAHRWESLTARAFRLLGRTSLVEMVPASLNLSGLSRLSLSYASPGGGGWVECIVPQYPSLQILEVSDFYINPRNIHVTTLQELVLKTVGWSTARWVDLFVFLRSNCALRRLRLIVTAKYAVAVPLPSFQVELPYLFSLTIKCSSHLPISQLLNNLQAPRLSELCLGPDAPRVGRNKWVAMDRLLGTCLDRFGALNQIIFSGLPWGASNAVRQDCRRRQINASESTGSSGATVTVRIDDEVWTLKSRRS